MYYKILFFFVFFTSSSIAQNEVTIEWKEDLKLSWNQFKAKPKTNISAVAVTASGISFGYSINETNNQVVGFRSNVYAHFYPEKSWYKKELATNHILAHEQLHFDITELYARKLRSQIKQLKVSNSIRKELRTLHENINKELAKTQNRYDSETDSSRILEAQIRWQEDVKKQLSQFEAYKS